MQHVAVYVRDRIANHDRTLSKEDKKITCRHYCMAKGLTVPVTFAYETASRDWFATTIAQATNPEDPLDAIVVWELDRFPISLDTTIEYRAKLQIADAKLLSASERWIEDQDL